MSHASTPDAPHPLVGTWQLTAFLGEDQATGERRPLLGDRPSGRMLLLVNGYMSAILTGTDRHAATTDAAPSTDAKPEAA